MGDPKLPPGKHNGMFPLELRGVSFAPGERPVVADLNLRLEASTRTVLLGPNGAGKSVTMRLMHGLLKPTAGEITWGGKTTHPAAQAMVFQRPVLLRRSALANIEYALSLAAIAQGERRTRANAALERVGLGHVAQRPARVLSGGEQQRVALARAWASRPDVLLLDEPTASLDPRAKHDVETLVAEFATGALADGARQGPVSLVFASHNLGQVKRLATRVIYLEQGRVLADLPVDQFFNGPLLQTQYPAAHLFVKGELP